MPEQRDARVEQAKRVSWNYTTFLNIAFLLLAAVLVGRFLRTGGRQMMAMMGGDPEDMAGHDVGVGEDGGPGRRGLRAPPPTRVHLPEALADDAGDPVTAHAHAVEGDPSSASGA